MKLRIALSLVMLLLAIEVPLVPQTPQQRGPMMGSSMMHGQKGPVAGSGELGFPDPNGYSDTVSQSGSMAGPFFMILGTNGRNCATCHQSSEAMSVSAAGIQARFDATGGTDPIFRTNDGSNCNHGVDVSSVAARSAAYSLLRTRGLIRVALSLPANADFEVVGVSNPYGCGEADVLSMYRRPLPSTNLRFLSSVMWDDRESSSQTGTVPIDTANYPRSLNDDLASQAVNAATGHAEAAGSPPPWRGHAVAFEMDLTTAQSATVSAGPLNAGGAKGGAGALATQEFFIGINDPRGPKFNPEIFDIFNAWAGLPDSDPRSAIARGQGVFNSKPVKISSVAGLNDTFNVPSMRGNCGTCHNTPNVGNHSVALSINIGTADLTNPNGVYYLPVFRLRNKKTGEIVQTTDPGRAVITGKFADIGKVKVPVLRGLAARAPYFHNGSALTLSDVVNFHDLRFGIGLTAREKGDLIAFLGAL
jgi:cytochrome c peroxidase